MICYPLTAQKGKSRKREEAINEREESRLIAILFNFQKMGFEQHRNQFYENKNTINWAEVVCDEKKMLNGHLVKID